MTVEALQLFKECDWKTPARCQHLHCNNQARSPPPPTNCYLRGVFGRSVWTPGDQPHVCKRTDWYETWWYNVAKLGNTLLEYVDDKKGAMVRRPYTSASRCPVRANGGVSRNGWPFGNLGSLSRCTQTGSVASFGGQQAMVVLSRQQVIVRLRRGRDHWRDMESHTGFGRVPLVRQGGLRCKPC